jgi:Big-like domain-containing protein
MRVSYTIVASALLLGACAGNAKGTQTTVPDCSLGGPQVAPQLATLHPGDTVRARGSIEPCPQEALSDVTFRWRASDTSVAIVDSVIGLVTARSAGKATIIGSLTANRQIQGAMALTVAP